MLFKKFYLFLFIILISFNVFAGAIEVNDFEKINFDIKIAKINETTCFDNVFTRFEEIENSEYYLTLIIENYVPTTKGLEISTYLNGNLQKTLKNKEIFKENIILLENVENTNYLKICITNNYLPKLIISKESKIGTYNLAQINELDLVQTAPESAFTNDLIPIEVFVKNTGTGKMTINLYNAYETYLKNSELDNVSGQTEYSGIILPGETKTIKYFIKTNDSKTYLTPRAIIQYTDEFGNEIVKHTNQNIITLTENENKLEATIDILKENNIENTVSGNLILINNSLEEITNIYILPEFEEYIELEKEEIDLINKKDIIEIPFKIKPTMIKEYKLKFNINYTDAEDIERTTQTEEIKLNIKEKDKSLLLITSILIALTIILFLWIFKF